MIASRQYSLQQIMLQVSYALLPAIAVYSWLFGAAVLVNILLAVLLALGFEALILSLRGRPLSPLSDGSAILTAVLLALSVPPLAPWWLLAVGVFFAIVIAKHLYGGLGFNPFNPAMIGFAVLLISFPLEMTRWPAAVALVQQPLDLMQTLQWVFGGTLPAGLSFDALSGATPLDTLKTRLGLGETLAQIHSQQPILGTLGGTNWQWVNLAILAGGLWLLWRRIISWHIPVALLGSLMLLAGLFHLINPELYATPLFHLFSGAAILGAFFIATDPVTAATSNLGKLWFGAGIGILTYVIRTWGGYPDAIAFAVLLMNMSAPTIDYYTTPRAFGERKGKGQA